MKNIRRFKLKRAGNAKFILNDTRIQEAKCQSLLRPKRLYFKVKLIWVSKSKVSTICLKRSFFIFVSSNLSCSFISKYVVRNILMYADSISCV